MKTENSVDIVRKVISIANNIREKNSLPHKCPVPRLFVYTNNQEIKDSIILWYKDLEEEVNCDFVDIVPLSKAFKDKTVKPNFKSIGQKYKQETKSLVEGLKNLTPEEMEIFEREGFIVVNGIKLENKVDAEVHYTLNLDEKTAIRDGSLNIVVALDINLSKEHLMEFKLNTLFHNIASFRKSMGIDVREQINLMVKSKDEDFIYFLMETYIKYLHYEEFLCIRNIKKNKNFSYLNDPNDGEFIFCTDYISGLLDKEQFNKRVSETQDDCVTFSYDDLTVKIFGNEPE